MTETKQKYVVVADQRSRGKCDGNTKETQSLPMLMQQRSWLLFMHREAASSSSSAITNGESVHAFLLLAQRSHHPNGLPDALVRAPYALVKAPLVLYDQSR